MTSSKSKDPHKLTSNHELPHIMTLEDNVKYTSHQQASEESGIEDDQSQPPVDGKRAWINLVGVLLITLPLGLSLTW